MSNTSMKSNFTRSALGGAESSFMPSSRTNLPAKAAVPKPKAMSAPLELVPDADDAAMSAPIKPPKTAIAPKNPAIGKGAKKPPAPGAGLARPAGVGKPSVPKAK